LSTSEKAFIRIEVPAKWVLSGEHSVLRGKSAVAFPHPEFALRLEWHASADALQISAPGADRVREALDRAFSLLDRDPLRFRGGRISIESSIPFGAGLGSSAALCVSIARLAIIRTGGDPSPAAVIPLATRLEDLFHGKSSGMDVNAIVHERPILFSVLDGARPAEGLEKIPRFTFHDSGLRGLTRECIDRVGSWREKNADQAVIQDSRMGEASDLAVKGLEVFQRDEASGLRLIQRSMELSSGCYEAWGLLTRELLAQKAALLSQGALAVRLTGAGMGGFWVALRSAGS